MKRNFFLINYKIIFYSIYTIYTDISCIFIFPIKRWGGPTHLAWGGPPVRLGGAPTSPPLKRNIYLINLINLMNKINIFSK